MKNEVTKTIRAYGKPITLVAEKSAAAGFGLFRNCYEGTPEEESPRITERGIETGYPISLWAVAEHKITEVKTVFCEKKRYRVQSGLFDKQLGCYRMMLREEKYETK